jgi:predicted Zn-dependent protease
VLLQRQGKFEGAQQALYSLCLAAVQSPELELTLGMVALRKRDRNPPAEGKPAEIIARVGRAECLAGQKKFDEARREYNAAVQDEPKFLNIHYAYGRFLLNANDTPAGIAELEQEIKNQPGEAIAPLQIAAAKYKIDSAGGVPYAEAAVKLDPTLPLGHYMLGLLLLDTGDYLRAIPELETAGKTMTQVAAVYSALGAAYSRAGRDEDAARARGAFLRLNKEAATSAAPPP